MIENVISASGLLDAAAAGELLAAMPAGQSCAVDFSEVTGIHFAALRRLMNARRSGVRFSIINASDEVVDRFVDTGVSNYIDICRKPRPLDMSKFEEFGASFMSKSYNSLDGDAMIKVYGGNMTRSRVAQEKVVARAVMLFGLPTPLVGTVYEDGEMTGLDFERIHDKRSFSRIIAEEPERTEEITRCFARMCKQLHQTPCDTAIFADRVQIHRQAVLICKEFTDAEREKILAFVDGIPQVTTCLHGDMQPSNVIRTAEGEDLWIDLGDFGYGYPLLDLGMLYFLLKLIPEDHAQHLFHLCLADLAKIWDLFAEEYAGIKTPAEKAAFEQEVLPYAALHMIYLGVDVTFIPGMIEFIKRVLL